MFDCQKMWRSLDGARGILESYQNTESEEAKLKLESALKIVLDDAGALIKSEPLEDPYGDE